MGIEDLVLGSEKLTAVFGRWPSFHDAEVVSIRLDRRPVGEGDGPTVEALVHAFEITREVNPDGFLVLRNHVVVRFRFHQSVEIRLEDFNLQNALFGLSVNDIRSRQLEGIHFEVRFDASFGVCGSLQCREVEVVDVTPCTPKGEPVHPSREVPPPA